MVVEFIIPHLTFLKAHPPVSQVDRAKTQSRVRQLHGVRWRARSTRYARWLPDTALYFSPRADEHQKRSFPWVLGCAVAELARGQFRALDLSSSLGLTS